MSVADDIIARRRQIAVVGLGYVGMPLALTFAKRGFQVIGYDINQRRIDEYRAGIDSTGEVGSDALCSTSAKFTCDETYLAKASFVIITVPTPINTDNTPNLDAICAASATVGRNMRRGVIVVYESTVYPGTTEDKCIPILEQESGLHCGKDFFVAYSPERVNPGDAEHNLTNIVKIVSAMDEPTLNQVAAIYEAIIEAGVFRASSIRVAEAAKVIENSQRDINIAFMNEMAMTLNHMDIATSDVIDAMDTKWNSLGFRPGLVGGHCIGIDPYYFLHKAGEEGYTSQLILQSRAINEAMVFYIGKRIVEMLCSAGLNPETARIAVLGITFKEDCPDVRNSKAAQLVEYLSHFANPPLVTDPIANPQTVMEEYGIGLVNFNQLIDLDCIVLAVAHKDLKQLSAKKYDSLFASSNRTAKVFIDVKSIRTSSEAKAHNWHYWSL